MRHAETILCFFLAALVFLLALLLPGKEEGEAVKKTVVRVWHVDTFEGGKGSRFSFLKSAARRAEARGDFCYLVTSYTPEGAEAALAEGDLPDAISFGVGVSAFAESALPLPYDFAGGEFLGETRAYPWCRGGYALFSQDGFEGEGRVAVSCGGKNLAEVAARLAGIEGDPLPSLEAYTAFLGGKYRFLLGTQRDLCRFAARGAAVEFRPLPAYCDLYQYYSVLSAEKRGEALALLEELLRAETQERLSGIGMYPVGGDGAFAPAAERTVSAFASAQALDALRASCGAGGNFSEKFLKMI